MKKQFFVLALLIPPFCVLSQESKKVELGSTVPPHLGWLPISNTTLSETTQFGLGTAILMGARHGFVLNNATGTTFGENFRITERVNLFRLSLLTGAELKRRVGPDV